MTSTATASTNGKSSRSLKLFDADEIRAYWDLLEIDLTEVRVVNGATRGGYRTFTYSGYFNDPEHVIAGLSRFTSWTAVWFLPNKITPDLFARRANRFDVTGKGDATSDTHILSRRAILLDTDPDRVAGISSTEAEHADAIERMREIMDFLSQNGWPDGVLCDSGNGGHGLYQISLPTEDDGLIAKLLAALAWKFGGDNGGSSCEIKIDVTNANPARAWKLPGTMACKGDNVPERPWRMANVIWRPEGLNDVTPEQVRYVLSALEEEQAAQQPAVEATAPAPPARPSPKIKSTRPAAANQFDMYEWVREYEPAASGPDDWDCKSGKGKRWTLDACAFDPSHTDGAVIIGQMPSGAAFYKCQHNSCKGRDWKEYRALREPEYRARKSNGQSNDDIKLGARDPQTGKLVLSAKRTMPTAESFVHQFHSHPAGQTLYSYAGNLMAWDCNRYVEREEEFLRHQLQPWLHDALRYHVTKDGAEELVPFDSNPGTIKSAVDSIRALTHLPASISPPAWLEESSEGLPEPRELLSTPSGNLHVPTGEMHPPTPLLFNVNAIDFEHDPNAVPPLTWLSFLDELWTEDPESIETLQEIAGYLLVADTSQQKMFLLAGPKRSGKGTIARVLARLVGAANVVGPTTSSLAGPFGLQPLIGKSVAIVSDARFTGDSVGIVVDRLLCISGEDTLTVDQKFKTSLTMKLVVHFLFLSNELPRMNDASGALAGRFIVLRLTRTFYGQEDVSLTAKLLAELPGILNWAIEGLKRLRTRGHFVQPASAGDAIREMEDLASPVGAFVREYCEVKAVHSIATADLFEAWQFWCKEQGRDHAGTLQTFGRDLRAAVAGITVTQPKADGQRFRAYQGIAVTADASEHMLAARMASPGGYPSGL